MDILERECTIKPLDAVYKRESSMRKQEENTFLRHIAHQVL